MPGGEAAAAGGAVGRALAEARTVAHGPPRPLPSLGQRETLPSGEAEGEGLPDEDAPSRGEAEDEGLKVLKDTELRRTVAARRRRRTRLLMAAY